MELRLHDSIWDFNLEYGFYHDLDLWYSGHDFDFQYDFDL